MDGFGLPSAMFVYNDAVGHMTRLRPPGTAGIVNLFGFPHISLMAAEAM